MDRHQGRPGRPAPSQAKRTAQAKINYDVACAKLKADLEAFVEAVERNVGYRVKSVALNYKPIYFDEHGRRRRWNVVLFGDPVTVRPLNAGTRRYSRPRKER